MQSFKILSLVVLVGFAAGCQESEVPTVQARQVPENAQMRMLLFGVPEGSPEHTVAEAKVEKALRSQLSVQMAFDEAVRGASSWEEADRKTRALLASPPASAQTLPAFIIEQYAADAMLRSSLVEGKKSADKQKALAFYTNLMIENRNGQAPLILPALERLEGNWNTERVRSAANTTARAAHEAVREKTTCAECSARQQAFRQKLQDEAPPRVKEARRAFFARVEAAASDLQEMSRHR